MKVLLGAGAQTDVQDQVCNVLCSLMCEWCLCVEEGEGVRLIYIFVQSTLIVELVDLEGLTGNIAARVPLTSCLFSPWFRLTYL